MKRTSRSTATDLTCSQSDASPQAARSERSAEFVRIPTLALALALASVAVFAVMLGALRHSLETVQEIELGFTS